MKSIIVPGFVAGSILLALSVVGLYGTIWFFPSLAEQYFDPEFQMQSSRYAIYYIHPFIISFALSWFWIRFRNTLTGSFLTRGIEFGLVYAVIALLPVMVLIYSALNVSLALVATWLVLGMLQGIVAGLVFEKMNP